MKKFNALDEFIGKKSKFCAEYLPGAGMALQCSGQDPVDVVLTACFGLVHFMMTNGRKGRTAKEAKAALIQTVEMAFDVYNGADSVTVIDLKEMRKQAQDADKQ